MQIKYKVCFTHVIMNFFKLILFLFTKVLKGYYTTFKSTLAVI